MPNLPDIPGKSLLGSTTRRAKGIAAAGGAGAFAVGGFVVKRVLDARSGKDDAEDQARPAAPEPVAPVAKPKPAKAKAADPKPSKAKAAGSKPAKAEPAKPKAAKPKPPKAKIAKPKAAKPGAEPGDQRGGKDPHHSLNNPVGDPDPTEYPDPFDHREDPLDPPDPDGAPFGEEPHPPTGAGSTSEPPLSQDPEVGDRAKPPQRDNLDD
jgi:hypothetical protein